jgi:hypothetical protein
VQALLAHRPDLVGVKEVTAANRWAKVDVLEAVYGGVASGSRDRHTLLCGDFNSRPANPPVGRMFVLRLLIGSANRSPLDRHA